MVEALRGRKVDAVVTYPPASVLITDEKIGHQIFSSSEIPNEIIDVIMTTEKFAEEHPNLGIKLRKVWQEGLDGLNHSNQNQKNTSTEMTGIKFFTSADQDMLLRTPGGLIAENFKTVSAVLKQNLELQRKKPTDKTLD